MPAADLERFVRLRRRFQLRLVQLSDERFRPSVRQEDRQLQHRRVPASQDGPNSVQDRPGKEQLAKIKLIVGHIVMC